MDDDKKPDTDDTEGNMPLSRVSPEGTEDKTAEDQVRRSVSAEGTEDDSEGHKMI